MKLVTMMTKTIELLLKQKDIAEILKSLRVVSDSKLGLFKMI